MPKCKFYLKTLFPGNADTNMCLLDHSNIVPSVSDCERYSICFFGNGFNHICFLARRHSAADDGLTFKTKLDEIFFQ